MSHLAWCKSDINIDFFQFNTPFCYFFFVFCRRSHHENYRPIAQCVGIFLCITRRQLIFLFVVNWKKKMSGGWWYHCHHHEYIKINRFSSILLIMRNINCHHHTSSVAQHRKKKRKINWITMHTWQCNAFAMNVCIMHALMESQIRHFKPSEKI